MSYRCRHMIHAASSANNKRLFNMQMQITTCSGTCTFKGEKQHVMQLIKARMWKQKKRRLMTDAALRSADWTQLTDLSLYAMLLQMQTLLDEQDRLQASFCTCSTQPGLPRRNKANDIGSRPASAVCSTHFAKFCWTAPDWQWALLQTRSNAMLRGAARCV